MLRELWGFLDVLIPTQILKFKKPFSEAYEREHVHVWNKSVYINNGWQTNDCTGIVSNNCNGFKT